MVASDLAAYGEFARSVLQALPGVRELPQLLADVDQATRQLPGFDWRLSVTCQQAFQQRAIQPRPVGRTCSPTLWMLSRLARIPRALP